MPANKNKNNSENINSTAIMLTERMLELSNRAVFEVEFNYNPKDTLNYIFAAELYLLVNCFKDESVKFMRIFSALPYNVQCSFMYQYGADSEEDDNDIHLENKETVENIFKFLLDEYPPPPLKHEFVIKLKSDIQRRNENPRLVYDRYKIKLKKIKKSIKLINLNRAPNNRIKNISDETKLDALKGIFIRKNNQYKYRNTGNINKLTVEYIINKNPRTVKDWDDLFGVIQKELISNLFDGMKEYEYVGYNVTESDFDIYFNQKRSLPYDSDDTDDADEPLWKRRRFK